MGTSIAPGDGVDLTVSTLAAVTRRFADVAETADLARSVPSCPQWSVEDLIRHIGGVHRWAAAAIGADRGSPMPDGHDVPRARLVTWYRECADELVQTLTLAGESAQAWVFAPVAGQGHAAFWIRRQIHETVMHTWDVRSAHQAREELDARLSWDGVEEVRDVFYPRQVALKRIAPLSAALHLEATDVDRPAVTIGSGEPIQVRMTASDLLLTLWHRADPAGAGAGSTLVAEALTP